MDQLEPDKIGCMNFFPEQKEFSDGSSLQTNKYDLKIKQLNTHLHSHPIPGKIINIEDVPLNSSEKDADNEK